MSVVLNNCLQYVRILGAVNGSELFGHERGNIEVFKALKELGAKVRVGVNARDGGGAVGLELEALGFETFPVPFGPQWSWQWVKQAGPGYAPRQFWAVFQCSGVFSREIRSFRPTHIHLGSPLAYSFLSFALVKCRQPLIWRMGDCPPVDSAFNLPIWRMGMRRSKRIVANSLYVKSSALNSGVSPTKISLIYNLAPVFSSAGADMERPPELREGETALVYVGAVSEHKGLLLLVEAFARIAGERPGLRLWILGQSVYDGDFRERLQRLILKFKLETRVILVGKIRDPSLWYAAAALHLAPSLWEEPAANVVLEAKREGTPSVVFPSGGLPELIRHRVDGYVCEEKTPECLAAAINWMLDDRNRLKQMSAASREDSVNRFGRERFLQQWAAVYLETLH